MLHLQLYWVWKLGNIVFTNYINKLLSFSRLTDFFSEPFAIMCGSIGGHSFHALHIELKGFSSFSSWMLCANFNNCFEISFSHLVGMAGPQVNCSSQINFGCKCELPFSFLEFITLVMWILFLHLLWLTFHNIVLEQEIDRCRTSVINSSLISISPRWPSW